MQVATRSRRLTVGVSLATASVLAISPLALTTPVNPLAASPVISYADVQLTAAYNPAAPWIEAIQTAWANTEKIGDTAFNAPAVVLQQYLANQAQYLGAVLNNPGSIGTVLGQVVQNVQTVILATTLLGYHGAPGNYWMPQASNDGWHEILRQTLPKVMADGTPPAAKELFQQVLNVMASPLSGVAIGLVGPLVSPAVALMNSLHGVVTALAAGDLARAVQHVIDIPANMVNGALNGATLNLDGLVPVLNAVPLFQPGNYLNNLNISFGGLFTAGVTGTGGLDWETFGIGGSLWNSIGLTMTSPELPINPLDVDGLAVGPLGALVQLGQIIATAIGWSGVGNPLVPAVQQPAGIMTVDEPAAELVSESPSAIPSAAISAVSQRVSSEPAAESASGAKVDEVKADDVKADDVESAPTDEADDVTSAPADDADDADDVKSDPADDTDSDESGSADDAKADDAKSDSTTKSANKSTPNKFAPKKSATEKSGAEKSGASEGGAGSDASSSDSQE
jgi:hypothetical protein